MRLVEKNQRKEENNCTKELSNVRNCLRRERQRLWRHFGGYGDGETAEKKIEKKIIILQTFSRVTTSNGPRLLKNLYFLSIHHHGLLFYYLQVYSCFHVLMSFLICFFLNQSGRFVL